MTQSKSSSQSTGNCEAWNAIPHGDSSVLPNGNFLSSTTTAGGEEIGFFVKALVHGSAKGKCEEGECNWGGTLSGGFAFKDGDEWKAVRRDTRPDLYDEIHGDGSFLTGGISFDPSGTGSGGQNEVDNSQINLSFWASASCPGSTRLTLSLMIAAGGANGAGGTELSLELDFICACEIIDGPVVASPTKTD